MKPPIPITDRRFQYVPSASTDLRKTFARIRDELAKQPSIDGEIEDIARKWLARREEWKACDMDAETEARR